MGSLKLIPPEQALLKLRAQLQEPVENLRHDDSEVEAWERVTLALVERTFGEHSRNANHFATTVSYARQTDGEAQAWHLDNIKSKKSLLRAFIKELEIVPPLAESAAKEDAAGGETTSVVGWRQSEEQESSQFAPRVLAPTRDHRAVIFTALALECVAVCQFLRDISQVTHPQGTVYERGVFRSSSGSRWDVLVVECGAGNVTTAVEVERAVAFFSPELILFVGIAGGLKDVRIGDVVVGSKVYAYESGKDKDRFESRPEAHVPSYRLLQRAKAEARSGQWIKRITTGDASGSTRALVGAIAAGEKVVASTSSASHDLLKERYGDTLAVEMEGYGFLGGAHLNPQVSALVIRGISDMIDAKASADAGGSQPRAAEAASAFAFELLAHLEPASLDSADSETPASDDDDEFVPDARVEEIIRNVGLGDWKAAAKAALQVVEQTDPISGENDLIPALLKYQNVTDDSDLLHAALQTLESCIRIAPWIISREQLGGLANHANFSVRSSAAAICMDLAHSSPQKVPVDILMRLSVYDEDWYVEAPANAALKAMASTFPDVLEIFFSRLRSEAPEERVHAANQIENVSRVDPFLLDPERLVEELKLLRKVKDTEASVSLKGALAAISAVKQQDRYRYGL